MTWKLALKVEGASNDDARSIFDEAGAFMFCW
jgi:hypothetical protein